MTDWQQLDQQYLMNTYQRYPLMIKRAEGNYIYDEHDQAYLDLFTGLAVNTLGHRHPRLLQAIQQQLELYLHISNNFLNPPAIKLAQRLVKHTLGTGKVFFTNSGAESSEALIKLIHKWTQFHQVDREGIVVIKNSFHGRTLGALRLTRQNSVYQDFPAPDFPIFEVEAEDQAELAALCEQSRPAAILVEPIMGSGGVISLSKEYLLFIQSIAQKHKMLFCIDEIQTGMGRTGTLFAYQADQLDPDCILFAKGIGGGLPLGGVIAKDHVANAFKPGDHGTTFAPSPLSAALGNAVFDVLLDDGLLEESQRSVHALWSALTDLQEEFQVISRIDGRGMMIGIHTQLSTTQVKEIQKRLLNNGFLVNVTAQTVIRLLPPLTLTIEEINLFIKALTNELKQLKHLQSSK
ncbi:acetylornithine aminotransferase [Seinonella peptonophila]|uniref:Acetylornithine aminotransferase n=1 Tax=Seinonella peptonophila TaxID=112248 RepID=A0A1M4ZFC1_9BACL|nr:aminotransferase class III-fold pyridoxal phosphate-dependent enzyme [Seinonella peptonophila]SHF16655.1 acetylornithine aminotransferase [Seinonella peptonophila]